MLSELTRRTQAGTQERRMMRRFDMRLPAVVHLAEDLTVDRVGGAAGEEEEREFCTETQNVSARGVFFYLDQPVAEGTPCRVTLTFPPHITLTDAVRVRFTARIIRVETPLPSQRIGTVAMIEDYEFLRSGDGGGLFTAALQEELKQD